MNYDKIVEKAFYISILTVIFGLVLKYFTESLFGKEYIFAITFFIATFVIYIFWNFFKIDSMFEKKLENNSEYIHPASYKK